jgi:chaperonin GroES
MNGIRLLDDNVLVRLEKPEGKVRSFWIPDSAERPDSDYCRGVVVAVGPGARGKFGNLRPTEVVPGDRVYFYWAAGKIAVTKWPDGEHIVIPESKIQAVIE